MGHRAVRVGRIHRTGDRRDARHRRRHGPMALASGTSDAAERPGALRVEDAMTHEPMERDAAVADALAGLAADRMSHGVNWPGLRRTVNATAASELGRRRRRHRMRVALPMSLVAGFVLFMLVS